MPPSYPTVGPRVDYFDTKWTELGREELQKIHKGLGQRASSAQQTVHLIKSQMYTEKSGSRRSRLNVIVQDADQTRMDWVHALERVQALIEEKTPKDKLPEYLTRGRPSAL